jgi:hypothetical protein
MKMNKESYYITQDHHYMSHVATFCGLICKHLLNYAMCKRQYKFSQQIVYNIVPHYYQHRPTKQTLANTVMMALVKVLIRSYIYFTQDYRNPCHHYAPLNTWQKVFHCSTLSTVIELWHSKHFHMCAVSVGQLHTWCPHIKVKHACAVQHVLASHQPGLLFTCQLVITSILYTFLYNRYTLAP